MQIKSLSKWFGLLCGGVFLAFVGCTADDPISPGDNNDQASAEVKSASAVSAKIYNNVASFKQAGDLLRGAEAMAEIDIPELENPGAAAAHARSVESLMLTKIRLAKPNADIMSVNGDSVIWDVVFEENGISYRSKLVYDDDTGIARLYLVGFQFPANHHLVYDSTHIEADLNSTLLDDSDDILLSVDVLKRYASGQLIAEEAGSFVPDPYPAGSEPTGGVLTSEITYANSSFISSTSQRFEYHEGQGASYTRESRFADGSQSREEARFNENGTGSFSELRRDGTQVEGEFDSAEDGQGSYSLTTTYPAGRDPVSLRESGEFTINPADSTLDGSFEREVTFADGREELEKVEVAQELIGGVLTTTLNVENPSDHGFITIRQTDDLAKVSGEWSNADETFQTFAAEFYSDDSAHLELQLYASEAAFENGETPIVSGVFDFFPDGSGQGVVTEGDQTYDVIIHPDGSVTITPRS